ncbi:MAG: DUF1573 domain-containing protein [Chlorobi bacterium CHB2]|nr:DUF1573 domain-containing protein [Chlorobi bacterium CHB2]
MNIYPLFQLWPLIIGLLQQPSAIRLYPETVIIADTARYASLHVQLINETDSAIFIESLHPSCGCVLASVQKNRATKEHPGDIYVSVSLERMDTLQPVVVDVFTSSSATPHLKFNLLKQSKP